MRVQITSAAERRHARRWPIDTYTAVRPEAARGRRGRRPTGSCGAVFAMTSAIAATSTFRPTAANVATAHVVDAQQVETGE